MRHAVLDDGLDPVPPDQAVKGREYIVTLWRARWRLLAAGVLIAFSLWLIGRTVVEPRYEARATVALNPVALEQLVEPTGEPRDFLADLDAEIQAAQDPGTRAGLQDLTGDVLVATVGVTEGSTSSLDFATSAGTPETAMQALEVWVDSYVVERLQRGVARVNEDIIGLENEILRLEEDRTRAAAPLDTILAQLADNPSPTYRAELVLQQQNLESQIGSTLSDFDNHIMRAQTAVDRLNQVQNVIQSGDNWGVTWHGFRRTTPTPDRMATVGFLLGLLSGAGLVSWRRASDRSLRSRATVERITGLKVVGLIPRLLDWDEREAAQVMRSDPGSPAAEAYRKLRASLGIRAADDRARRISVTSSLPSEGTTTTVANLAVAIALTGQRVLVVDVHLADPRLHLVFGVPDGPGFVEMLAGADQRSTIHPVRDLDGLRVLPAGSVLPASEGVTSLDSMELERAIGELDGLADVLLFDVPPVLATDHMSGLSSLMDAVLLVVLAGETQPAEASEATMRLNQADAPLVCAVLNGVSRDMPDGCAFKYGYGQLDRWYGRLGVIRSTPPDQVAIGGADASLNRTRGQQARV